MIILSNVLIALHLTASSTITWLPIKVKKPAERPLKTPRKRLLEPYYGNPFLICQREKQELKKHTNGRLSEQTIRHLFGIPSDIVVGKFSH